MNGNLIRDHLTPRIIVESTQLPGKFNKDPADQLIVATARVLDVSVLTAISLQTIEVGNPIPGG